MKSLKEYLEEKIQLLKDNEICFIAQTRLRNYLDKSLADIQYTLLACKETERYTKLILRDSLIDLGYIKNVNLDEIENYHHIEKMIG